MSRWAGLDAEFRGVAPIWHSAIEEDMPRGSESGPSMHVTLGAVHVDGRMRDFDDCHSPKVLAWFLAAAQYSDEADLTLDIDDGPRYRYHWRNGELVKLKGVLDL